MTKSHKKSITGSPTVSTRGGVPAGRIEDVISDGVDKAHTMSNFIDTIPCTGDMACTLVAAENSSGKMTDIFACRLASDESAVKSPGDSVAARQFGV